MKTALLIIDVQQALCVGEWAAFEAPRVIDRINVVSRRAREAGIPVIVIQHNEDDRDGLFLGSPAWELADGLEIEATDIRLDKRAPDSFHRTELESILREHGVTDLIVCGLQSDFCVDSTTRGALAHGYPVTLVSDGHTTLDNGVLTAAQISAHHTRTLASIGSFGVRVTPLEAAQVTITN